MRIEKYLKHGFDKVEEDTWKSKKKRLGIGTGDDSTLYIYCDDSSTSIWWQENRGFETTIFEGRSLKYMAELEMLFDLLNIKDFLFK